MVGDLRRTFIGWLKKTEMDLKREKENMALERQQFEDEKTKVWKQFMAEKAIEYEKIKHERRQVETEGAAALKQIQVERDDHRRKLGQERQNLENEIETNRRKMLLEREKFRAEFEGFENERRRIVDTAIATETMVDLNVGGTIFETSRHTLVQQKNSLLEALLSGRHKVARDRQGRIFIDRDSELFRSILNFLRKPTVPPTPKDSAESEALCKEADHYGVRFFPFPLVFACGGHNSIEHLKAMEVLDVGQQCWRPCRPMQTERSYFGAAVLEKRLHLFGGQNLEYKSLVEMESYDCLTDRWMLGSPLNNPRRNCCATSYNERMFAIGGFSGSAILSSVEAYDPRMKSWMPIADLNTPRSAAAAAVHDNKIYVLGGTSGARLSTIETYEFRMNKWETHKVDMLETRSAGCCCSCYGMLYALGGTDQASSVHNSVEVLEPEAAGWSFRKNMLMPRMDAACCVVSESIMCGGGQAGEVMNSTEFYMPEEDSWQPGPNMLFPRYGHAYLQLSL
eukprot:Platyproteum_vivax@DN310_c0_g1_i1.p1